MWSVHISREGVGGSSDLEFVGGAGDRGEYAFCSPVGDRRGGSEADDGVGAGQPAEFQMAQRHKFAGAASFLFRVYTRRSSTKLWRRSKFNPVLQNRQPFSFPKSGLQARSLAPPGENGFARDDGEGVRSEESKRSPGCVHICYTRSLDCARAFARAALGMTILFWCCMRRRAALGRTAGGGCPHMSYARFFDCARDDNGAAVPT